MIQDEIIITFDQKRLTACIYCEIDHHTSFRLRKRIDEELFLRMPQVLCIDFSNVRFMDSSGIALIIGRAEAMAAFCGSVRIIGLSAPLLKIVKLSGVDKLPNLTINQNALNEGI